MMLAIKESASDMSPYVRKTSAHAIQKLYRYCGLWLYVSVLPGCTVLTGHYSGIHVI
jgi:hypothetical protein